MMNTTFLDIIMCTKKCELEKLCKTSRITMSEFVDFIVVCEAVQMKKHTVSITGSTDGIGLADGDQAVVMIVDVSETTVTLDANPPMAGFDLNFDLELVEIV
jgi:hypothetical protein